MPALAGMRGPVETELELVLGRTASEPRQDAERRHAGNEAYRAQEAPVAFERDRAIEERRLLEPLGYALAELIVAELIEREGVVGQLVQLSKRLEIVRYKSANQQASRLQVAHRCLVDRHKAPVRPAEQGAPSNARL